MYADARYVDAVVVAQAAVKFKKGLEAGNADGGGDAPNHYEYAQAAPGRESGGMVS